MLHIPIYQIDAFTHVPFKGNPAAVCALEAPLPARLMQAIAAEMNLSETAFFWPEGKTPNSYRIRFFTPSHEVNLCGHATLATTKVLSQRAFSSKAPFEFEANEARLMAQPQGNWIQLDFPQYGCVPAPRLPDTFWEALTITNVREAAYSPALKMILIEVGEGKELLDAEPDFAALKSMELPIAVEGVICSSHDTLALPGRATYDFMSRCFFPWIGINEDPVTGAAHTLLGPYWAEKLQSTQLHAYQASARGGEMKLELAANGRMFLRGQACLVMQGELRLDIPNDLE
ncbi:MAG: PhzF family phenazine biosynthesis protein [Microscillaceae bacterium]